MAFERFGLLVGNHGTCPKGYILVDGKCVPDNRSYAESKLSKKYDSMFLDRNSAKFHPLTIFPLHNAGSQI
jgi:hypothetical protein